MIIKLQNVFKIILNLISLKNNFSNNLIDEETFANLFENVNNIVQYGWKKEAVPIVQKKVNYC